MIIIKYCCVCSWDVLLTAVAEEKGQNIYSESKCRKRNADTILVWLAYIDAENFIFIRQILLLRIHRIQLV